MCFWFRPVKRGANLVFQFTGTGTGTGSCCKTWDERALFQFPYQMSVGLERELERVRAVKRGTNPLFQFVGHWAFKIIKGEFSAVGLDHL